MIGLQLSSSGSLFTDDVEFPVLAAARTST